MDNGQYILIKKEDWDNLPLALVAEIFRYSKKSYGLRLIENETNKETHPQALLGGLGILAIKNALDEVLEKGVNQSECYQALGMNQ
jgi:hypothetical protein